VKVGHVEEQKLGSKVDLQQAKVEHVEKGSRLNIQVEIVDQIYNQRFQNYLNYRWIQKSIIQNVASRSFKRARNQLNHINHSYTFFPIACTTIEDVDLNWNEFVKFYKLLQSIIAIHEHVIAKFPNLLHFLDFWVVYKEEKKYP
jgi:hypothetical protein